MISNHRDIRIKIWIQKYFWPHIEKIVQKKKSLGISGILRLKLSPYRFNIIAMSGLKLHTSMRKYTLTR